MTSLQFLSVGFYRFCLHCIEVSQKLVACAIMARFCTTTNEFIINCVGQLENLGMIQVIVINWHYYATFIYKCSCQNDTRSK